MRKVPTPSERYAGDMLASALGLRAEYADALSGGAADWHLFDGDRLAVVAEVTELTDGRVRATRKAGGYEEWAVPGGQWRWRATWDPSLRVKELRPQLARVAVLCEQAGVTDARHLYMFDNADDDALRWFDRVDATLRLSDRDGPGVIVGQRRPVVAFAQLTADPLTEWINTELHGSRLRPKIDKLPTLPGVQRHLFVDVDLDGPPAPEFFTLANEDMVPIDAPDAVGLDGLWLAPELSRGLLRWLRGDGWARIPYSDLRAPEGPEGPVPP